MTTTAIFVEHVLWQPGSDWDEALEHLASRFARSQPLDLDAIRAAGPFHLQVDALAEWATTAGADLDRELGRWFDEHLAMHVRPAPAITRAVRALASAGTVHGLSALPARAAESIARHAGCFRSFGELHGDIRSVESAATVITAVQPHQVVAGPMTPLPSGISAVSLLDD